MLRARALMIWSGIASMQLAGAKNALEAAVEWYGSQTASYSWQSVDRRLTRNRTHERHDDDNAGL